MLPVFSVKIMIERRARKDTKTDEYVEEDLLAPVKGYPGIYEYKGPRDRATTERMERIIRAERIKRIMQRTPREGS